MAVKTVQFFSPAFIVPVIISVTLLSLFFLRRYLRWNVPCPSKKRLDGKTVIITGANAGLGKATAYELAKRGAKIYLACRNIKKAEAVARVIKMKTENEEIHAALLDLASLRSIEDFVRYFTEHESALHVLINNGAYMGPRAATEDGYERNFGVNYLGHFYLTHLLKDKLKKCAPSRIVNVVSDSYTQMGVDFEDLSLANYDIYKAYGRSKRALLQFTVEAHRHWFPDGVLSFGAHPGPCTTELMRNWPGLAGRILRSLSRFLFKTPEEGCQTIVCCAVADGIRDQSGQMFENCKPIITKNYIRDKAYCRQLWKTSLHLCGLKEDPEIIEDEDPESHQTGNGTTVTPDKVKSDATDVDTETKKEK